jgi:hypothetical protein
MSEWGPKADPMPSDDTLAPSIVVKCEVIADYKSEARAG